MRIHDWRAVPAGIFHDFRDEWISRIKGVLNRGILPPDHYALAEQVTGEFGPDVLTLEGPGVEGQGSRARSQSHPVTHPRDYLR